MVEKSIFRKRGRPRSFDSDEVLDKIIDVFWEHGYDAADMETLAKCAGLTKPSLYNAFGAKEDLFVAALVRYLQTRSKTSLDALTGGSTPHEGIHDYFLCLARIVAAPGGPTGCLIVSIAMPVMNRLPKVAALLESVPKETDSHMMAWFSDQMAEGALPQGFNPAAAIELMQDLGGAMIMQARARAPLQALIAKVTRNTELVLHEGQRGSEMS